MKKIDNLFIFRMRKMLISLNDHLFLIFKSAAHNHLRIQKIRRGEHGGIFCSLSFYSYTALKNYQKKVRAVSAALVSGMAIFLVALTLMPVFFDTEGSRAAGEAPTISSITPNSGVPAGGTSVTISGSNFSVPDAFTKLLLHANGVGNSFIDSSLSPKTVTALGASSQSSTQSKFGGKSASFNGGASDYLSVSNSSDFNFGTGDFTVEWWEYRTSLAASATLSRDSSANPPFVFGYAMASGMEAVYMSSNGSSWDIANEKSMGEIKLNTWSHLAIVRSGNNFYTFRDGVIVSNWTSSLSISTSSGSLSIGNYAGYLFNGYVDEIRISKDIARWTSDFSSTLPTSSYYEPNVSIGGTLAVNISTINSTTITATTPAHASGAADVVVMNPDGQSGTLSSGFTYTAPPTISSILPTSGSKNGGDSITITGTGFYGAPNLKLGGTDATNVIVVNSTTITATTPAHVGGVVDVLLTNPDSQTATLSSAFTFREPSPIVTSINPTSGSVAGGTNVTISGSNFTGGIDARTKLILHGDGTGTSIIDSSIIPKNITVNGSAIQSAAQSKFGGSSISVGSGAYLTVGTSSDFEFSGDYTVDTWIYPTSAPSTSGEIAVYGNHVGGGQFWDFSMLPARTILLNLYNNGYLYSITSSVTVPLNTWTHIAGVRNGNSVKLYVNGIQRGVATYSGTFFPTGNTLFIGRHATNGSIYFPGFIDEFKITKGVALWTSDFTPPTIPYRIPNLTFGGTTTTNILSHDSNNITAITPAHSVGATDVIVTNHDGQSSTLSNGFTYVAAPTISSILPNSGSKNGGDSVTITGTGFYGSPSLKLGGTDATNVTVVNSTTITATTPAHAGGIVDVLLTSPDLQTATLSNGFTFMEPAPAVSSIAPNSGPVAGGTNVTISGSNFGPQSMSGSGSWATVTGKTLPANLARSQSAVIGNTIYLFGGYNGSAYVNTIYSAPVSDPTTWTNTGKTLPINLGFSQLAVIGDNLYLFGGGNGTYTNLIYTATVSDPTTWVSTGKTLPGALGSSSLAIVGDYVYLFGGYLGGSTGSRAIYQAPVSDPTTWVNTTKLLPANLGGSQVLMIGDKLYLFGGYTGSAYTNVIYTASLSDPTTWTNSAKTLPASVAWSNAVVIGTNIYLYGGVNASGGMNTIYTASIGDPLTWSNSGVTMPASFGDNRFSIIDGYVYMFGGGNGSSSATNAIYRSPISVPQLNFYNKLWLSNWSAKSLVTIGGAAATSALIVNTGSITAVAPYNSEGAKDVVVTNYDGQSSTLSSSFTYIAAPIISSILPNNGSKNGGDSIIITGTGFYGSPSLKLGGTDATNVTVVNSTTITATTPAHAGGIVDVLLTSPDLQTATLSNGFTFMEPAPIVSSVTPNSGPISGGTDVTINGSNFSVPDSYTKLLLRGDGSGNVIMDSSISAKAVSAFGSVSQSNIQAKFGPKSLIFNGGGDYLTSASSSDWEFGSGDFTIDWWEYRTLASDYGAIVARDSSALPPFLVGYSNAGMEGIYMTSNGSSWDIASMKSLGAIVTNSWNHLAVVRSGNNFYAFRNGVLTSSWTSSLAIAANANPLMIGKYNTLAPISAYVDELRISKGIARWNSNFTPPSSSYFQPQVNIDGIQANITSSNATTIIATTPAHAAGAVDVLVANTDGQSSTLSSSFTYIAAPTISSILPNNGSKNGGDSITITGTGFYGTPNLKFGGTDATNVTVVNSTTITATTPAHAGGIVDVLLTNPDSQTATLLGGFTFNEPAPIVSSINPTSGPVTGGTSVAISGSNFISGIDQNTKLLLHADGSGNSFTDSSLSPKSVTALGNATQSLSQSKFGGSSAYFNKGLDALSVADFDDWNFSSGDFSIDFWARFPTLPAAGGSNGYSLISQWADSGGSNGWGLILGNNDYGRTGLWLVQNQAGSSNIDIYQGSLTISTNTWYHIAVTRQGNNFKIFIDGQIVKSATSATSLANFSAPLMIGKESTGGAGRASNVFMDEIRISKGVARWTNTFTVPSSIYYPNPTVSFGGVFATNVSFTDSMNLIATTPAHFTGAVDVVVANYDGQSSTLSNGFTYVGPPVVNAVNPSSVNNNQSVSGIDISGIGFQNGATIKFKMTGEADIVCSNVVFNNSSSLSCDGDFHGIKPGNWNVEITNADGQVGTGNEILNVIGEVTQIKFITPSYTVKQNVPTQGIRIQLQDSAGRPTTPSSDVTIDLSKVSSSGEFSSSRTSWSEISSVSFLTNETTKSIYYKDTNLGTHGVGAAENPSGSWTDASQNIIVSENAPYVWPFDISTDYQYDSAKIDISNSDAVLTDLSASGTIISNVSSAALTYSSLTSFSEVLDYDNEGSVKYQLSNNDGTNWYWWNGSTWVSTTQGVAEANDAPTINAHIATFNSAIGQIGNAKLSFKAFFIGDGSQKVSLDSIFVGYALFPYKYVFTQKPASLNETEEGMFVVEAQDQNGNVIIVDHDTNVSLATSTPATGFFATDLNENIATRWDKQAVTIQSGQSNATFYYKDSAKGNKTVSANPPGGESSVSASYALNVTSKYRFLVTGISDPIQAGVPSSVTIQAVDYLGNPVTNYVGTVHFTSTDLASNLPANNTLTAPMLSGRTYVNGVTMMTQAEQCVSVADVSDPIITGSQCDITVTAPPAGVASELKIVSNPQFVPVGDVSSAITVQLQDINGSAVVKATPTTVYVYRTTASGQFSADGITNWTNGAFSVVIPAGATSINFFYKDDVIGSYSMTVSDDNVQGQDLGLTNDTQQLSAVAGSPESFSFNSGGAVITAGTVSGALNFSLHDSLGNQVTTQSNQVAIITSSNGAEFSLDGSSNWTTKLTTNIPAGGFDKNFYYRNNTAGNDTIIISDSDPADGVVGLDDASVNLTVNSSSIARFVFLNSPVNLNIGDTSAQMTIQSRDIFGNVVMVAGDTNVYLYSNDLNTTFSASASPFTPTAQIIIPSGGSTASFYFTQSVDNGSIAITASDNSVSPDGNTGIFDATQTETISQGAVSSLVITSAAPLQLVAGEEGVAVTVESRNVAGVKVPMANDKTIYFHSNSVGVKEFSMNQSPSWTNITSTLWTSSNDSLTFYYKDTKTGSKTITVGDDALIGQEAGITNATLAVNVSSSIASKLKITTGPLTVETGEKGQLTVEMQDEFGNASTEGTDRTVNLSSDNQNGIFMNANDDVITSVVIPAGNSSATVYYKNNVISNQILSFDSAGLTNDTQVFSVLAGSVVTARMTISSNSLVAGTASEVIDLKLYNSHGIETNAAANLTVNMTSDSATGRFDLMQGGTFGANNLSIIIPAGSSNATFYFKDAKTGNRLLYSNGSGLSESTLNLNVAANQADHLGFTSNAQIITVGQISNVISGKVYDEFENEVNLSGDLLLSLASSSQGGEFSLLNSPWISVNSLTIPAGQNSFSFFYKDADINVADITVSSTLGNITQKESIISGLIQDDAPAKLFYQSSPQTSIINSAITLDFYLANASNQYTVAQGPLTVTVSTNSATGLIGDGNGNWLASMDIVFAAGESVKSFEFKDSVSGNPVITIASAGLTAAQQQQTILNGNIEKIVLESSSTANTVDRVPVLIRTMTNSDLPVAVSSDTTFSLNQSASGQFFESALSQTPITSATISAGNFASTVYFQQTVPGNITISVDENPSAGWTIGQKNITVSSVPSRLRFVTASQSKQAGQQSDVMTVILEDIYGNVSNANSDLALHLSSSSQFGEFSILPNGDWASSDTIVMGAGTSTASFFYKDTLSGSQTLTVSDVSSPAESPDTGYQNATQQFAVTSSDVYSLNFLTAVNNLEIGQVSSAITVQAYDQYGNAKIVGSDLPVYLYSNSATGKFSLSTNFSPADLISNTKISAGTSVATFYYRDLQTNASQITVSDKSPLENPDLGVLNASQQVNVVTGNVASIVWETVASTIEEGDGTATFTVKTTNSSGIEIPVLSDLPIYFSARYTTASNGLFANSSSGPWGINSSTIVQGNSRATFYYKDTIAGVPLIIVSDETPVQEHIDSGLVNASSYVTIIKGAISKIVFNSNAQSVTANHPSQVYQIQTLNRFDVPTNVSSNKIIYVRSSSNSGEFSANGQDWGANGITISADDSTASFYYRDAFSGTYTLTAADTLPIAPDVSWTNAVQSVTITPQQLDHFNVRNISDPQKQGTPSSVVVSPVDSENYVIKEYAGTIVEFKVLDANGDIESASLPDFPYTFNPAVDNGIKTFVNAVAFYSDGEKTFSVKDAGGIVGLQQGITVVQASANPLGKVRFVQPNSPLAIAKRTASPLVTVQLQDAQSEPTNATSAGGYDVRIASLSGGEFSTDGSIWVSDQIVLNVRQYTNFATFYYRNSNKVNDQLTVSDWNGAIDDGNIDNDIFEVNVVAGEAEYLQISGQNSQVAGSGQIITVTAKDRDGDKAVSYTGDKNIVISGAGNAFTGQIPTCTNKDNSNIELGSVTILNFVDGEATCQLKLYRKETAEIKVTDGTLSSFANSLWNLSVDVFANVMNQTLSVLSAIPNPQQAGAPVVVSVLPKDVYGNISDKSSFPLQLSVSGANNITGQQFVFDINSGTYQTAYTPQNSGIDLISATLNGAIIGQDSEGISDGTFHETIEGQMIVEPTACDYLKLDDGESETNRLVFDACMGADKTIDSDELSKSSTRGTWVSRLQLSTKADSGEVFSGEVEINSSMIKPTNMSLSSEYSDQLKFAPYVFLRITTEGNKNLIERSVFRVVISNQWMSNNSVIDLNAVDEDGRLLNIDKVDSLSDYTIYEISADEIPDYIAILGLRQQDIEIIPEPIDDTVPDKDEENDISVVDKILDPVVRVVEKEISVEDEDRENNENFITASISKLFKIDSERVGEIVNTLAVVSVGAAAASAGVATAASFPMLSYMFGGIRTLSAVPYRRKQKWGIVYDSETGKPLSSALVIITDGDGKVKEMKNTDSSGFYSFLAPKGTYMLEVKKSGYSQPENSHIVSFKTYYDGSYIPGEKIELEQEAVISENIPMLKQEETLMQKIINPSTVNHTIFWAGFSFSVFALIINTTYFNAAILLIFIANLFINYFYKKNLKTGTVLNADLVPAGFSTIKIFSKNENKLIARTVANEKGIYFIAANEGEYIIEAQNGISRCVREISLTEHCEIKERLVLM